MKPVPISGKPVATSGRPGIAPCYAVRCLIVEILTVFLKLYFQTDTPTHSNNVPKSKTTNDVGTEESNIPNIEDMDPLDYSPERLGRIQFSVKYDFQEMTLTLRVMRGVELPAKDFSGTSDPYVKIMLLPDKKHKLQTNIKRRNLNPRWNEVFAFEGIPLSF